MRIPEHTILLENAGFELAGPETWGKLVGEVTAFVEVSAASTSAYLYAPETDQMLGPKLHITGEPERTVPAALFQLEALMGQEEACGDVVRAAPENVAVERLTA